MSLGIFKIQSLRHFKVEKHKYRQLYVVKHEFRYRSHGAVAPASSEETTILRANCVD